MAASVAVLLLAGCGTFDNVSNRIVGSFAPYRVEVVQGNFISREQVQALRAGMSREQVKEVLGTPRVTSLFHADRWDYVFTLRRQGVEPQQRKLTVFFKADVLERHEGDTMPSESEFVAALDRKKPGRVPVLEATEEQLRAAAARAGTVPAAPATARPVPATPPATSYPPLEPAAR